MYDKYLGYMVYDEKKAVHVKPVKGDSIVLTDRRQVEAMIGNLKTAMEHTFKPKEYLEEIVSTPNSHKDTHQLILDAHELDCSVEMEVSTCDNGDEWQEWSSTLRYKVLQGLDKDPNPEVGIHKFRICVEEYAERLRTNLAWYRSHREIQVAVMRIIAKEKDKQYREDR